MILDSALILGLRKYDMHIICCYCDASVLHDVVMAMDTKDYYISCYNRVDGDWVGLSGPLSSNRDYYCAYKCYNRGLQYLQYHI